MANDKEMDAIEPTEKVEPQADKNKRAGKKIGKLLLVVAFCGGLFSAYWFLYGSHYESTDDAYVAADQNAVTSQINSTIVELNIQDGQDVTQNFLAVQLDHSDFDIALQQAKAMLANAVRNYSSLQLNLSESKNTLDQRQSSFDKALADYTRDSDLVKSKTISNQAWLDSKYALDQARIALSGAQFAYNDMKVKAIAKDVYHHPSVIEAINNYKQAYLNYERTEIKVPVDGRVAKRAVYIGQRVASEQTLFTVVNVAHEWVDVNLKESQLKEIKVGQSAELISDVNGNVYKGYVSAIGAGSGSALSLLPAQNATGNWIKIVQRVPIRVDFDKDSLTKNGILPIGTSIRVTIDLRSPLKSIPLNSTQKTDIYQVNHDKLDDAIKAIINENTM